MKSLTRIVVLIAALLLTFCAPLLAAPYQEVDTLLLKAMLDKDKNILLVYPLSKIEYNDLHIAGSIFIPLEDLKEKLPADRTRIGALRLASIKEAHHRRYQHAMHDN